MVHYKWVHRILTQLIRTHVMSLQGWEASFNKGRMATLEGLLYSVGFEPWVIRRLTQEAETWARGHMDTSGCPALDRDRLVSVCQQGCNRCASFANTLARRYLDGFTNLPAPVAPEGMPDLPSYSRLIAEIDRLTEQLDTDQILWEVWYAHKHAGMITTSFDFRPAETHSFITIMSAPRPGFVFSKMQGETMVPGLCGLIQEDIRKHAKYHHTSMSVGDVVVCTSGHFPQIPLVAMPTSYNATWNAWEPVSRVRELIAEGHFLPSLEENEDV